MDKYSIKLRIHLYFLGPLSTSIYLVQDIMLGKVDKAGLLLMMPSGWYVH